MTRQIMRFIAWREGAPTDTSRDYEFTDWNMVRQFALDVATDVLRHCRHSRVSAGGLMIRSRIGIFSADREISPTTSRSWRQFSEVLRGTKRAFSRRQE